jgi:hypothetical protein
VDYNNDGKKDLIVGEGAGFIRIYINNNTDANPVFGSVSYVKVGSVNKDFGDYSAPYLVDWDEDGKRDVLCGANDGNVYLLINTGTNTSPAYSSAVKIYDGSTLIDVGSRSAPVVFDWDDDGKKDLLVGAGSGVIRFYSNVGTNSSPSFSGFANLEAEGSVIDCGNNTCFDVCDWTNDGMSDLMVGSENILGSPRGPVLYFRALFLPVLDAKVNGDDGPINVPKTTPLEFKIALQPGSLDGVQHDWWIWIEKGYFNKWWCRYNGGNKNWTKNVTPIRFAGAALQQVNGYKVLGPRTIPAGNYYFRFAIDEKNDEYEGTFFDEVEITTY